MARIVHIVGDTVGHIGRHIVRFAALAALAAPACDDVTDEAPTNMPSPGATTGTDGTTFNHDNDGLNLYDYIERLKREGPLHFTSRLHSCAKISYTTLGNVLASVGVNLDSTAPRSAAVLYREGKAALAAPDHPQRIRESRAITTASAAREFDIFAAAADEIIAAVPNLPRCRIAGVGAKLFDVDDDGNDRCVADGIACLIGVPAQQAHLEQCNTTLRLASSIPIGKRLAVALLMAAAYTCE